MTYACSPCRGCTSSEHGEADSWVGTGSVTAFSTAAMAVTSPVKPKRSGARLLEVELVGAIQLQSQLHRHLQVQQDPGRWLTDGTARTANLKTSEPFMWMLENSPRDEAAPLLSALLAVPWKTACTTAPSHFCTGCSRAVLCSSKAVGSQPTKYRQHGFSASVGGSCTGAV